MTHFDSRCWSPWLVSITACQRGCLGLRARRGRQCWLRSPSAGAEAREPRRKTKGERRARPPVSNRSGRRGGPIE